MDEPLDELAALHQDVGGAVSPSGLEPKCECAVLTLLESFAREEAVQRLAHDLVKKSLLRLMALIPGHEVPDWDRRGWSADKEVVAAWSRWHWSDAG
jgi:hypothetical protein